MLRIVLCNISVELLCGQLSPALPGPLPESLSLPMIDMSQKSFVAVLHKLDQHGCLAGEATNTIGLQVLLLPSCDCLSAW